MIFSEVRIEKENLKFNTNIFCPKKNHSDSDKNKNLTLLVNCAVWIWNIHSNFFLQMDLKFLIGTRGEWLDDPLPLKAVKQLAQLTLKKPFKIIS